MGGGFWRKLRGGQNGVRRHGHVAFLCISLRNGQWVLKDYQQCVEKQASGRQSRRAAFWKAQHIHQYVSIYKIRTTPDQGLRRGFSTPC
jgi:hypothetical protein